MDSTAYVVFLGAALVLVSWVAVHFWARSAQSHGPEKSSHKRHLSDDTQ